MASASNVDLHRAENFRRNLRRIFDSWAVQAHIARDADINPVHLSRILSGTSPNPTLDTVEKLAIALEVPVETLIAAHPCDSDLRIFAGIAKAS